MNRSEAFAYILYLLDLAPLRKDRIASYKNTHAVSCYLLSWKKYEVSDETR